MTQRNENSAFEEELGGTPRTRLTLIPEETREQQFTPTECESLGKVYQLLADVARRALEQERAA